MSILNIFFGAEDTPDNLLIQKRKEYEQLRERMLFLESEILEEQERKVDQEDENNYVEELLPEEEDFRHGISQNKYEETLHLKEEELKSRELLLNEREEYIKKQELELKGRIREFQSSSVGISSDLDNESDERDKAVYIFLEERFQQINSSLKDLSFSKQEFVDKDSIIKDLHKELQEYKGDLYKQILSPIILELISWIDKIRNTASFYYQDITSEQLPDFFNRLRDEYGKLSIQVEDILYNFDIEPYSSEEGESFNVKKHKALLTELTVDSKKDKTVKSSIKAGYMDSQERIIRKEEIVVYKFENN